MVPSFLLLLISSTASAYIRCVEDDVTTLPSIASCDIALGHLARYLLPCVQYETVVVNDYYTGLFNADIRLPAFFGDESPYPAGTPRCMIMFHWAGGAKGWDIVQPGKLQTLATDMKKQCIAASPPKKAEGRMGTNDDIWGFIIANTLRGDLAIPGVVNGTLISGHNGTVILAKPADLNPTGACQKRTEPLYEVDLNGVSDIT